MGHENENENINFSVLSLSLYTTFIFRTLTFLNNDLDLDDYDDEEYELHGEPLADRDPETIYAKVSSRSKNRIIFLLSLQRKYFH